MHTEAANQVNRFGLSLLRGLGDANRSARSIMLQADLTKLAGWEEIRELIPEGNFLRFTEIWSLHLEHYLDAAGDQRRRLQLELCENRQAYGTPTIRITMEQPGEMKLSPGQQICGLAIDDYSQDGWEHGSYHLYDYETSNCEIYCEDVSFARGSQIPPYEASKQT